MFDLLFITSLIGTCVQGVKENTTKPLPPNAWENKELYFRDLGSGMDMKQIIRNAENGKYTFSKHS